MKYKEAPGWLTLPERDVLYRLARRTPHPLTIVNIGVEYGASVICLEEGAAESGARVVGVDLDLSRWQGGPRQNRFIEGDSGHVGQEWLIYSAELGANLDIGLLFIDGDHSYNGVKRDLVWTDWVAPGGHVLFHDCYEWEASGVGKPGDVRGACPEVNQAVSDWFREVGEAWIEKPYVDSIRVFQRK